MLKKLFGKNFILFISMCFSLSAAELFLKIFSPLNFSGHDGNYKYDKDIGATLKEGYFSKTTDYKQEVLVNSLGTINPHQDLKVINWLLLWGFIYSRDGFIFEFQFPFFFRFNL